ncbi:prolyl oligopeptidase family serine peptidase [Paenibacillus sp. HN-1]|uniref:prolyl oligopeptidase family serine peptidase n=1 Tax=Paenibacillus TaxID=44249 RepID=UPI001CA8CA29|nr:MULTISPECIES: prolyl oligopeptidase family serine peptidase [Paenibacillus]MBY9079989.1 prolyl oligopeptidase family serine peptidase [Paenibacillus sp. CGMCC 1.18879]MBY9086687.1 prolyl oligopeptidase family serine peptidase [Paenibacillus sinensis]
MPNHKAILKFGLILACLVILLPSCSLRTNTGKGQEPQASSQAQADLDPNRYLYPVFTQIEKHENIVYANKLNAKGSMEKLLLDLYEPAQDSLKARPVLLMAHGGSFSYGSKSDMAKFADVFAKMGYVVISADYRLRDNANEDWAGAVSDAVDDMGSLYDWIEQNGADYGIDPGKIAVSGESAGGELTLTFMNAGDRIWKNRDKSRIFAVINLYGPMSTSHEIDPKDPPVLFIHGTEDRTADYGETLKMVKQHQAQGVYTELYTMEGEGHGTDKYWTDVLFEMTQFLHKTLLKHWSPDLTIKEGPVFVSSRGDRFRITLERKAEKSGEIRVKAPDSWEVQEKDDKDGTVKYEISVPSETSRDYYPVSFQLSDKKGKVTADTTLYVNLKNPLELIIKPGISTDGQKKLVNILSVKNRSGIAYSGTLSLTGSSGPAESIVLKDLQPGAVSSFETPFAEGTIKCEASLMNGVRFSLLNQVDIHHYEAEKGQLTNAQLGVYPADSGGYHVGHLDALGSSVEFDEVYAEAAGAYTLAVTYSNGWGEAAGQSVSVNGDGEQEIVYPPTASWGTMGLAKVGIRLNQGMNTIKFSYNSQKNADLDAITISKKE